MDSTSNGESVNVIKRNLSLQARLKTLEKVKVIEDPNYVTPRIMIGVPILAWSHRFALSFMQFWTDLMTYQHKGRKFEVCYNFKFRRPVHLAEEELAEDAVESGCTHLLLMDDDIYDVTVEDLLKLLDADKDVIGGIMHTSGFPYAMCAFRRFDKDIPLKEQPIMAGSFRLYEVPIEQRFGVQPVDLIPFGFTLIKTSVFSKLEKPWFTCTRHAPTDSCFADSILEKHMGYYAHFGVWLNHNEVTRENVQLKVQIGMAEEQRKNPLKICNITKEEMEKHNQILDLKMKESEKAFLISRVKGRKFFSVDPNNIDKVATLVSEDKLIPNLDVPWRKDLNDALAIKAQSTTSAQVTTNLTPSVAIPITGIKESKGE